MTYRRLKGQSKPIGICWDDTTRLWFWDCRICPGVPTVGHHSTQPGALADALHHAAVSSHHRPVCRCDEPDTDPYECEADDCSMFNSLVGVSVGGGGRVGGWGTSTTARCQKCSWSTTWQIDDGSAEADLHSHMTRVHPAA